MKDSKGNTALHYLIRNDDVKEFRKPAIEKLLECGISINEQNTQGQTALHCVDSDIKLFYL
jgi:ankyrin repeat protein